MDIPMQFKISKQINIGFEELFQENGKHNFKEATRKERSERFVSTPPTELSHNRIRQTRTQSLFEERVNGIKF